MEMVMEPGTGPRQVQPIREKSYFFHHLGRKMLRHMWFLCHSWALLGVAQLPLSFLLTACFCCWWFLSWHLI